MRLASLPSAPFVLYFALWSCGYRCCAAVPTVYVNSSVTAADGSGSNATSHQPEADGHNAVARIKYVAYSVIALVIVALGIVGNLFNLMDGSGNYRLLDSDWVVVVEQYRASYLIGILGMLKL